MISRETKIIFSISLFIFVTLGCIQDDESQKNGVFFSISAESSGNAEIYIPIPEYNPLVTRLEVEKGEGEFNLVDTPYGRCMRINFNSYIRIVSEYYPSNSEEIESLNINLTTIEPNTINETDRFFWYNASNGSIESVNIYIRMYKGNMVTKYMYNSNIIYKGWNRYNIEYFHGEEFAP
jgi:hypothetical protein